MTTQALGMQRRMKSLRGLPMDNYERPRQDSEFVHLPLASTHIADFTLDLLPPEDQFHLHKLQSPTAVPDLSKCLPLLCNLHKPPPGAGSTTRRAAVRSTQRQSFGFSTDSSRHWISTEPSYSKLHSRKQC